MWREYDIPVVENKAQDSKWGWYRDDWCIIALMDAVCLDVHLSVCPSMCMSIYLYVHLSVCPSIYMSIYLYVHLSVCPSACPSHLYVFPSIWKSIYLDVHLPGCPSICMSIYMYVHLSVCPSDQKNLDRNVFFLGCRCCWWWWSSVGWCVWLWVGMEVGGWGDRDMKLVLRGMIPLLAPTSRSFFLLLFCWVPALSPPLLVLQLLWSGRGTSDDLCSCVWWPFRRFTRSFSLSRFMVPFPLRICIASVLVYPALMSCWRFIWDLKSLMVSELSIAAAAALVVPWEHCCSDIRRASCICSSSSRLLSTCSIYVVQRDG